MVGSSLTPMLTVSDAAGAIDFYRRAFGALEVSRVTTPSGQLVAEMSIDGERFFVGTRTRKPSTSARSRSTEQASE